ncbi:hypothetical protein CBA19CS91_35850 [Paraburkholderia hospita]|nr:hypothetical protein CBA19CS91_35850 [Paraburkholderia hospita]
MLDRLIRILGYIPASSNALVPRSAALSAYGDLHRRHADGFDRSIADSDPLCSWHADGEGFHYAVGRDDWAPLAVAGFCLTDNDECRAWLNDAIRVRFWLTHDVLASWHAANQPVLRGFGGRRENHRPEQRALLDTTAEHEIAPLVKANEMAELFALTWKRYYLSSPFQRLGNSAAFNRLALHHTLRLAAQTNEHALERVIGWLALWLEARGLTVDRREQLVYLPGYQALYFRSDAEQWP